MNLSTKYYLAGVGIFVLLTLITTNLIMFLVTLLSFAAILFGRLTIEERHSKQPVGLEEVKGQWDLN